MPQRVYNCKAKAKKRQDKVWASGWVPQPFFSRVPQNPLSRLIEDGARESLLRCFHLPDLMAQLQMSTEAHLSLLLYK